MVYTFPIVKWAGQTVRNHWDSDQRGLDQIVRSASTRSSEPADVSRKEV